MQHVTYVERLKCLNPWLADQSTGDRASIVYIQLEYEGKYLNTYMYLR